MLGKFYIEKITKVPGSTRMVVPVALHKNSTGLSLVLLRERINAGLDVHGYRLSKFHKHPFNDIPAAEVFKKNAKAELLKKYIVNISTDLTCDENNKDYYKLIYFTVSKL